MNPSVSLAHPFSVSEETLRFTPLRRSAVLSCRTRHLNLSALSLLLVVLTMMAVPGFTAAAAQEYGPDSYGCYYSAEGGQWTEMRCPQTDGSNYYFVNSGGEWEFAMECAVTSLFTACLWATGEYMETYPDGSTYIEDQNRKYLISHTDGSLAEGGYYDSSGAQRVYRGASTMKNSAAMRNRSSMYWIYHNMSVQTVVQSNPSAFAGLITMTSASNDYANCLHLNDSSTDFDSDNRTGFTELAEHCTQQAYG